MLERRDTLALVHWCGFGLYIGAASDGSIVLAHWCCGGPFHHLGFKRVSQLISTAHLADWRCRGTRPLSLVAPSVDDLPLSRSAQVINAMVAYLGLSLGPTIGGVIVEMYGVPTLGFVLFCLT